MSTLRGHRFAAPRPGWGPMAVAMGSMLLIYTAWQVFHWPPGHRQLIGDAFNYPFDLAAIATGWFAVRRCASAPRLATGWKWVTAAITCNFLGDVAWNVYELLGAKPYPSLADAFYLGFYPLMFWALIRLSREHRSSAERVRLALDTVIVSVAGSAVVICAVLGPTVQGGGDPLQMVISIAYPVGDMILLVALASILLRNHAPASLLTLRLLAAALLFWVVADVLYGYLTLHSSYQGGDLLDEMWIASMALMAVAAAAQTLPQDIERPRRRASWAPSAAVAIVLTLLLFNLRHDPLVPDGVLVIAAVVLTGTVSIRQFLAQRDLVRTQGRLSYQSVHDALTGLPNRALVLDRAEQLLARARRTLSMVAALYVDIDGFKQINDSFGHATGDELLRLVAARLSEVVRDADTVGRLGGDEFVVLLDGPSVEAGPELVAERICAVIGQPVELDGAGLRTLTVTASIGIALGQGASAEELFRDADLALYEAKAKGKNRWVTFESRMQRAAQDRLELEMDLRDAIMRDELFLLYQPTVDLRTEAIRGVEALLRWRHETRGIVPPGDFIPLAEETGLIVPIGRWVLREACRQAAIWQREGRELQMSVNVSTRQLDAPDFLDEVAHSLAGTGVEPDRVTLEITETSLMHDPRRAARLLASLKELGVQVAIDDFGTGYSSLAYLRQFPLDELKIDRSFVAAIAASGEAKALIHTLVQLAKSLGLTTLGEGIEDDVQLHYLQREECDLGQGFLFARPMDPAAIEALLATPLRRAVA